MGNLIAFGFDRSWAANEVLKNLRTDTALDDAFVVERSASGRCAIRRASDLTAAEADASQRGGLWGALVRFIYLNSSLDLTIPRGSSALFVQLTNAADRNVLRATKPYRARILETSLSQEAEQRLKAEFTKAA
jgi:uncharacterized membrane protein